MTPDISEVAQFGWYDPVWYWDPVDIGGFPNSGERLGRMLGIAHDRGCLLYTSPSPRDRG